MADLASLSAHMHLPRPTIRLRLSLIYGSLFLISGAMLLGVTYFLVSSATGNPVVYTTSNGDLSVSFGGVAGPGQNVIVAGPGLGGLPGTGQIQGLVNQQHADELNQLLVWSIVALAIMVVASIGIGWLVAGRVLQPLRSLTATVREVSATNLRQRVAPAGPDDELKDLGLTFDDLLGRLDRSFEAQRQFVANASHELRTPLARQRALIQVALDDPNATAETLRATCERVLAAETQQEGLIEALLTLARSERAVDQGDTLDLAAIAGRVVEARRQDIASHGLTLQVRLDPAPTSGDTRLVERLAANLVDNAIRYNVPDGRVEVSTSTVEGCAVLRIANSGPFVPPSEVERLFEPFKRLGADRTVHGEGWGLGLSIVRAIAGAHDATVAATSRPNGGLDIEVAFPG